MCEYECEYENDKDLWIHDVMIKAYEIGGIELYKKYN